MASKKKINLIDFDITTTLGTGKLLPTGVLAKSQELAQALVFATRISKKGSKSEKYRIC
jgi:hypothetical protein